MSTSSHLYSFALQVLFIFPAAFAAGPLVTLSHGGQLEGTTRTTLGGREVICFGGVRYGNAERFQNPKPAASWSGVRDASNPSTECLQYSLIAPIIGGPSVIGEEDCLSLDVCIPYLPNKTSTALPVVVMIADGDYTSFGAQDYGAKFLLDRDIVYVSINYRVGILGFLSTRDAVMPGNWGMKDQALALKWIKHNINAFGGDPNSVTLIGQSSGGASVHLHYFSPLSKGLFHRGIAMSGVAGSYWSQMAQSKKKAQQLGTLLKCPNVRDSTKLRNCLLTKDGKEMTALYINFRTTSLTPFAPVIEKESNEAFLTKNPRTMIKQNEGADLPLIISFARGENLAYGTGYITHPERLTELNTKWNTTVPTLLNYVESVDADQLDIVSEKIRHHFFGKKRPITKEMMPKFQRMIGGRTFLADIVYTGMLLAQHLRTVYCFEFDYFGSVNVGTLSGATLDLLRPYGPSHADDIAYISNTTYLYTANTDTDIAEVKAMVNMVVSFATTGKPTYGAGVQWAPISKSSYDYHTINYLHIKSPTVAEMEEEYNVGDYLFWTSLPLNEPAAKRGGN